MTGAGRLLDLLENLPDHMLEEALESQKKKKRGRIRRAFYVVAAAACIMVLFMTFVPAGQAMAAQIREGMVSLLEKWFPPKEIPVYPEGEEENITHEIYGDLSGSLPEQGESGLQEAESITTAGFAIYVDRENFETLEDGEDYLIREKPFVYTREATPLSHWVPSSPYKYNPFNKSESVISDIFPYCPKSSSRIFAAAFSGVVCGIWVIRISQTGRRFHSMIKTFKVLSPEDSDMQAQFEEETPDTQTGD